MKKLSQKKYNSIFFSPHIDDVVLSCGGLISKLEEKEILVVTIFSDYSGEIYSRHAKCYLNSLKFDNANEYFNSRKKEEKLAAKILDFDFEWLDFPEAIFRFKKKLIFNNFFYTKTSKLFGSVSREDKKIMPFIRNKIKRILKTYSNTRSKLYFPLGIGNHIDHQILNEIGMDFQKNEIFFYEDFPYCSEVKNFGRHLKSKKVFLSEKDLKTKLKAITAYKSQLKPLFKDTKTLRNIFVKFYKNGFERYWYVPKKR